MSTTEPFGLCQLEDALRRLNIPDVSAPDLGALPFAHSGAGLDYAGIAAAVVARELRPPVGIPSTPSSFYFLELDGRARASGAFPADRGRPADSGGIRRGERGPHVRVGAARPRSLVGQARLPYSSRTGQRP